jgi:hypothetical protein
MQPTFGWTLLSRDALRRAETQLRDDEVGVLDEIGFLALHQAYADRFFPGTSVLHARLRYVLFIPWIYERIAKLRSHLPIAEIIEKEELELTRRLKLSNELGVIGDQNYPKPTVQPPSMMYWSALNTWRIIRPVDNGTYPSRRVLHQSLRRQSSQHQVHDDDKQPLFTERSPFVAVPSPPVAWDNSHLPLTFNLEPDEREFLQKQLLGVSRPGEPGRMSLLSRLVERNVSLTAETELWSQSVLSAADTYDRAALMRAKQAAALAAIGRAVYSVLVEQLRTQDGLAASDHHLNQLRGIVDRFRADALRLTIEDICIDAPSMLTHILAVLRATQLWLTKGDSDPSSLLEIYAKAESNRKGPRARLSPFLSGKEKRAEWIPNKHPKPEPLHYRWKNVRRLLIDLQEAT